MEGVAVMDGVTEEVKLGVRVAVLVGDVEIVGVMEGVRVGVTVDDGVADGVTLADGGTAQAPEMFT
jgi:hypothetical protein